MRHSVLAFAAVALLCAVPALAIHPPNPTGLVPDTPGLHNPTHINTFDNALSTAIFTVRLRGDVASSPAIFIPAVRVHFGLPDNPAGRRLTSMQIASAPRLLIRPG